MLLQSLQMGLELFFVLEWSNREILPQHSTRSISSRRRIRGGRKRNLLGHHREKQRREHHHAQRHPQAPTTEQFFFVVIYGCSIIVVVVVVHRKKKRVSFSSPSPLPSLVLAIVVVVVGSTDFLQPCDLVQCDLSADLEGDNLVGAVVPLDGLAPLRGQGMKEIDAGSRDDLIV